MTRSLDSILEEMVAAEREHSQKGWRLTGCKRMMITFFSTPKPFRGHIGVIQRNAIQSWRLTHPDAEVILFGDEAGAAEVARRAGSAP